MLENIPAPEVERILKAALTEDIGAGDVTTLATVPPGKAICGRYIAKEAGVLCGLGVVARVFAMLDAFHRL